MTSITSSKSSMYAGKKDKILLAHVQRICEAHDTVMRSYYQQIHGSFGADRGDDVDGEHWRTSVCVNKSQFFCHQLLKKSEDGAKLE